MRSKRQPTQAGEGLVVLANASACAQFPVKSGPNALPASAKNVPGSRPLSPEELQRELFLFVDRYRERVAQVADEGAGRAATADQRAWFQATKTVYASAAVSVVTGPRPIDALRDLLVMLTLQRMVWEAGAAGMVPPEEAERMAGVLRRLEVELYDLAARAMPSEAIEKLRIVIEMWRRENPDQHYVAYVRFQNLGASPIADEVSEIIASGGLLSPVEAVAREAHEARLFAERSMYLASRMPMLVEWHTILAYQHMAASPEVTAFLGNLDGYRAALERLGQEITGLPANVSDERRALLADFQELVGRERSAFLKDAGGLLRREREALFLDLHKGAGIYRPLVDQLALTAAATRDAVAGLERMSQSREGQADDGVNLERVNRITEQLATAASATNEAVAGLQSLLSAELRGLSSLEAMVASLLRRLFFYAAALVLLIGGVLFLVLRSIRRPAP